MSSSKLKLIIALLIILIAGVGMLMFSQQKRTTETRASESVPDLLSLSPIPVSQDLDPEEMSSPDGKKKLILERQQTEELLKYSLFTSNESESKLIIYSKELPVAQAISIPFNTWSPDNIHFFVKESSPEKINYFVFLASGENFPDNVQYLSVQELFEEKVEGYFITDVTGWAAPSLLIVNTKENEGDDKVSFWLDVRSQSFIRLGTYFE
ncbi:hypothetical protein CO051_01145 [Candidatus Roizmanbacteria bacterium CG_4_9_14_0_2_um_filter_39_13]|uniref:Uncharacterized protein n=2 Tax=Candidatus Roizmaniibacteriota TaxID=1752723 RepID=A0A2M8F390_9BACT|nr:MAG: hypothetical protein COY15_01560 [Candidatus Roizmanbacteria bacterium CG_4_10_14_0_2_um_filter_39_12]PJC33710.1 MAG: hypothetical protein CO051_01145 [Candidatus Roizmanbacteria bacterium CG_4_9_14_0_2_um_filter_39_13]PJE62048.1 MAG: hypothetical protein COU87_01305 [Candidatus Roizmanbacteria bacterium CG10_big_fil_rev_8_21_14_0_10_39_12]